MEESPDIGSQQTAPARGRASLILLLAVLGCFALIAYTTGMGGFCGSGLGGATTAEMPVSLVGLELQTVGGEPFDLGQLRGKPAVIDVWATWCPPCREQRTILHELQSKTGERVRVVGVSVDSDARTAQAYLDAHGGLETELFASAREIQQLGNIESLPTLLFADADGRLRKMAVGVHSAGEIERILKSIE